MDAGACTLRASALPPNAAYYITYDSDDLVSRRPSPTHEDHHYRGIVGSASLQVFAVCPTTESVRHLLGFGLLLACCSGLPPLSLAGQVVCLSQPSGNHRHLNVEMGRGSMWRLARMFRNYSRRCAMHASPDHWCGPEAFRAARVSNVTRMGAPAFGHQSDRGRARSLRPHAPHVGEAALVGANGVMKITCGVRRLSDAGCTMHGRVRGRSMAGRRCEATRMAMAHAALHVRSGYSAVLRWRCSGSDPQHDTLAAPAHPTT